MFGLSLDSITFPFPFDLSVDESVALIELLSELDDELIELKLDELELTTCLLELVAESLLVLVAFDELLTELLLLFTID